MKRRNWLITTVLMVSIIGLSLSLQSCATKKINLRNTLDTRETLQVQAYWDPIADASLGMHNSASKYESLFNNLSPARPTQEYDVDAFKAFFPKGSAAVGSVWKLDPKIDTQSEPRDDSRILASSPAAQDQC